MGCLIKLQAYSHMFLWLRIDDKSDVHDPTRIERIVYRWEYFLLIGCSRLCCRNIMKVLEILPVKSYTSACCRLFLYNWIIWGTFVSDGALLCFEAADISKAKIGGGAWERMGLGEEHVLPSLCFSFWVEGWCHQPRREWKRPGKDTAVLIELALDFRRLLCSFK